LNSLIRDQRVKRAVCQQMTSFQNMSEIELIYFNIHGGVRGLLQRMVLKFGEVDFKDTMVELKDWPQVKPTMILGGLPVVKVDGKEFCQATALVNYFSKIGSMARLNPLEDLKSNMVHQTVVDTFVDGVAKPAFGAAFGGAPDFANMKPEQIETFYATAAKCTTEGMGNLERALNHLSAGNGVVEGKVCVGDLAVLCMLVLAKAMGVEEAFATKAPTSMKLAQHLMKQDKLKAIVEDASNLSFFPFGK